MRLNTESFIVYKEVFSEETKRIEPGKNSRIGDDIFDISIFLEHKDFSDEWRILFTLKKDISIQLWFNIVCTLEDSHTVRTCTDVFPVFNNRYIVPVFKKIVTSGRHFFLHANRNYRVIYKKISDKKFMFEFMLDAPCIHPAWNMANGKKSIAAETQKAGTIYSCNFSILYPPAGMELVPAIPLLYPGASKSCFVLTDHCDFDTEEKLRLFLYGNANNGWLNKNLKITKGVFTLSSKSDTFNKNDSLEDPGYLSLIEELHRDGSEIVPHALKSKGQLSKEDFLSALGKISNMFMPATWIDHGSYLKYCYSQGGKYHPDYKLIETLQRYGYSSLWSFHDVNTDALHTLNIFSNRVYPNGIVWKKIFGYLLRGKLMIAAHYLRSIVHRNYQKNIISDFLVYNMANAKGALIKWKTNKKKVFHELAGFFASMARFKKRRIKEVLPYNNDELLRYSDVIFPEERRPLAQYKNGDMLMFSTFEATHIKDIYSREALDKLIDAYGLHIGHTYILNDLPYLANIFSYHEKKLVLSSKWIEFTDALSGYVKNEIIWNPNMCELIYRIISFMNIEFEWLSPRCFEIFNKNNHNVPAFTFLLPVYSRYKVSCNQRILPIKCSDQNFHFYCIDLPGNEKVIIELL